jgi:hypothetical protein
MDAGTETAKRPCLHVPSPIGDPLNRRAVTAPSLFDFEILANEVYHCHEHPEAFYRFARSVLLLS